MRALRRVGRELLDIVWYVLKQPSYSKLFLQGVATPMLAGLADALGEEPPQLKPLTEREKRYVRWGMEELGHTVAHMSPEHQELFSQCATTESDE